MKKFLLTGILFVILFTSRAQLALNEVYVRPGNGQSEFFELYNNAKTNININLDCYTILSYFKQGSSRGWYVLDLPQTAIPPAGFYSVASSNPFDIQGQTGVTASLNWNSLPGSASLTKWELNGAGTGYTQIAVPANLNDFFEDLSGVGMKYIVLLYKQSGFQQGFLGGSGSNLLPAEVVSLPALTVPTNGACTSETFSFSSLSGSPFLYFTNPATGNDNGYSRLYDGNCSEWDKSAAGNEHTPNATNNGTGNTSPYDGTVTTSQLLQCLTTTSSQLTYNVTGVTGAATLANSFPVTVELFTDLGTIGQYDPGVDVLIGTQTVSNDTEGPHSFSITGGTPAVVLLYTTANGCYDKVFAFTASCITLPVNYSLFTAVRNRDMVNLKWETLYEINNTGFAVERKNGNGVFETIAMVPSQATVGASHSVLRYSYSDLNNFKGISQYRIRQTDVNGNTRYTEVRAVRGAEQNPKTIIYPNPAPGRLTVVFEEETGLRDVLLIDGTGKAVKQWMGISSNVLEIDYPVPGIYTLRVTIKGTGQQFSEKIIMKNR